MFANNTSPVCFAIGNIFPPSGKLIRFLKGFAYGMVNYSQHCSGNMCKIKGLEYGQGKM